MKIGGIEREWKARELRGKRSPEGLERNIYCGGVGVMGWRLATLNETQLVFFWTDSCAFYSFLYGRILLYILNQ